MPASLTGGSGPQVLEVAVRVAPESPLLRLGRLPEPQLRLQLLAHRPRPTPPPSPRLGVDLGGGPVGGLPAVAGECDDVEPELVVRQRQPAPRPQVALGLRSQRDPIPVAGGVAAAADP
jgi:hypothetical protein